MTEKLAELRSLLQELTLDGYMIPSTDEYQSEYTPLCARRLEYICGFSGSNGLAIITMKVAYLITDGRYINQAKRELPEGFTVIEQKNLADFDWDSLNDKLIGYDPKLLTIKSLGKWEQLLTLCSIETNLIDRMWQGRPKAPNSSVFLYPLEYAGLSSAEKLKLVRKQLPHPYYLITKPENICWLLNIRASDVPFCPIMLGSAVITPNKIALFTDISRISPEIKQSLAQLVDFYEEEKLQDFLTEQKEPITIDPNAAPAILIDQSINMISIRNPISLLQSAKTSQEIRCSQEGHIKDAIAVCEALSWVYAEHRQGRDFCEHDVSLELTKCRSEQAGYIMDSFPAIVGFRENGAVIHYRPPVAGSKIIKGTGLLLIDSGGHYFGATTDITRTLALGEPTAIQRRHYTLVLKGHIALARQKVLKGANGACLDVLARQYLWQEGLDYAHGTGHGVGNALSVHEGPISISSGGSAPIKENMIFSNEPGFYVDGEYGIRIENLLYVAQSSQKNFWQFHNLTLIPYCYDLIELDLMTSEELSYLKDYYKQIEQLVLPKLSAQAAKWCLQELQAILSL